MPYTRCSIGLRVFVAAVAGTLQMSSATAVASPSVAPTAQGCAATAQPGSRAYSPMYLDGTLLVYAASGSNLTQIATVDGLSGPGELVVTGDGRKIYVNDWGTGSVRVIDACTLQTTKLIDVGTLSISTYRGPASR